MKTQELKVGDSFEVVEVLDNLGYGYLKGRYGIAKKAFDYIGFEFEDFDSYSESKPYLFESEVKPIGKLTITKLK